MHHRILIIENTGEYSQMLSACQHQVDAILSGTQLNQIIEKLLSGQFSLILLVIHDNFFNDISIVEAIKNDERFHDLPVIVIDKSSFSIPNNIKLAFQSGANDFVKSDVSDLELQSRIDNQLKLSRRIKEVTEENITAQETLSLMDKLFLFMDRADNSFVIFSPEGEIEWVNEGFNRMYGYTIDEFKRKFGRTLYKASKNSDIESKIERCVKSKKSVNYVAECLTRNGEFKWIQTTLTPVITPSGTVDRFIAIETDITKLKETEESLNQKNEYMMALANHLKSANALLEQQQIEINEKNKDLEVEKVKSEELLLNILPFEVARQLKSKGEAKPKDYKFTSVLFLDFSEFTKLTLELDPKELVSVLDTYFKTFDDIVEQHFIEKIKTIGDAYMCVGGLPLRNKSNPFDVVLAGLEIQHYVNSLLEVNTTPSGMQWRCRIGIHTGPVIAGVVGRKKYLYDIWGNTVNIAARMQTEGSVGRVNVSGDTFNIIKDYFEFEYRGKIAIKNADKTDMYFVNRLKPEFADDQFGLLPNEAFKKMLNSL